MGKRIEVGVLGATGMVGQQFIQQLAGHPWFELTWLAASERSEGKSYADAAPWRLETPIPEGIGGRTRRLLHARQGPAARVLGARRQRRGRPGAGLRRRRPRRAQQRAQPPHGPDGAAARARGERRSPGAAARAGEAQRRQGRHRHEPELLDGGAVDGARAAAGLRPARLPREHDAGRLGRRVSGRALARHPRQRDPVHLGRGREDGDRDAQDPRHAEGRRRSSRTRCA